MNLIFLILIISILVSLYVLFPIVRKYLFSKEIELKIPDKDPEYTNLLREKNQVLNEIKDIDLDYGLEKLDKKDYKALRDKYRRRAAGIIMQIEKYEEQNDPEIDPVKSNKIEEEIKRKKENKFNSDY